MKRLFLSLILVTGISAIATSVKAQVYIGAHFGVRLPIHRAYIAPQVVYNSPDPYYDNGVIVNSPAPCYDNGIVVGANVYNSYSMYNHYPAYRHYYSRDHYRESRVRHFRRW